MVLSVQDNSRLAFGLDSLAPDLLWIVLLDITESEFRKLRREKPGKEVNEGTIDFIPASFGNELTQEVLSRSDWGPAGKASLIRAIQLIEEFMPTRIRRALLTQRSRPSGVERWNIRASSTRPSGPGLSAAPSTR